MNRVDNLKTVVGFDFGMRHIGVAVGQTITMTAKPQTSLRACDGQPDWKQVAQLLFMWRPDALIVGVPVHLNGKAHEMTFAANAFIAELGARFALPIHSAEERLTSVEARARLFEQGGYKSLRKQAIDGLAAQLIVEGWFSEYYFLSK